MHRHDELPKHGMSENESETTAAASPGQSRHLEEAGRDGAS